MSRFAQIVLIWLCCMWTALASIPRCDSNNAVLVTYTRGLDFSGGINGAGGIGGLLARTDNNGSTIYHADGSGNVTALMDGMQNIVARYEYDPYGRMIGQWGKMAGANAMRFSSMPAFQNSGLVGYHARFYEPGFQRWLNRDPIGEGGGVNLYGFVGNGPANNFDVWGFAPDPMVLQMILATGKYESATDYLGKHSGSLLKQYLPTKEQEDGTDPTQYTGAAGRDMLRSEDPSAQAIYDQSLRMKDGAVAAAEVAVDNVPGISQVWGLTGETISGHKENAVEYGVNAGSLIFPWIKGLKKCGRLSKAINLPAWDKVTVNMAHIAERHMAGGALTAGRDIFAGMNERGVLAAIRQAYGTAETISVQGERVLLSGTTDTGMTVEMWFNKATRQIESAWPQTGRTMGR